ncbi:MAG: tRNA dihydrouridine(20/20a) synthase DusA [Porticoccaceae bacterium]|nr:tRNA dihydrouridine(20/20a) synthase DusA [Porticoccaceae bacterium]
MNQAHTLSSSRPQQIPDNKASVNKASANIDSSPLKDIKPGARRFCVAPMLDRTDRFCRYFFRQISREAFLYTEMITTGAILHGDQDRHLSFDEAEHPVAVQLGGSNPEDLARSARIAENYGYAEVNLNCGCPSDRVQAGRFGACMMLEPNLVADGVKAMRDAVSVPVTVKCRIGVDDSEHYDFVRDFIGTVTDAGCDTFIIHARKAWLKGLSPKQNREVPPLDYPLVYRLKQDFPELEIIINGGINTLAQASEHLQHVDGVMLGREACQNPWILADVDKLFYSTQQDTPNTQVALTRDAVVAAMLSYAEAELSRGARLQHIVRPMLNLYQGQPNGRRFRRYLSENAHKPDAGVAVLAAALETIQPTTISAEA